MVAFADGGVRGYEIEMCLIGEKGRNAAGDQSTSSTRTSHVLRFVPEELISRTISVPQRCYSKICLVAVG
jgi:hypothetical protein